MSGQLQHFGVKGMRWGVRRADPGGATPLNRAEKKHLKKAAGAKGYVAVHNATAKRMNDVEIPRLNNKPAYKNKDFSSDSPLRRKYYKEYENTLNKVMVDQYNKQFGTAPTGRKVKFDTDKDGNLSFEWDNARHADDDFPFIVRVSKGYVIAIEPKPVAMAQSDGDDIRHYGVKGMRWGVRDGAGSGGGPRPVVVTQNRPGGPLVTRGGSNRSASDDAVRAAMAGQKARKSGTQALSNKELQDFVTRANLERQYNQIAPKSAGRQVASFMANTLMSVGKQEAAKFVAQAAAKQVAKAMGK